MSLTRRAGSYIVENLAFAINLGILIVIVIAAAAAAAAAAVVEELQEVDEVGEEHGACIGYSPCTGAIAIALIAG